MLNLQLSDLHVINGDDEPRVRDLRLAETLELVRPSNIRNVITKNREELERHASLHTASAMIER